MEKLQESLKKLSIHDLRNYAREVGVRAPTSLTKGVLISEIMQIKNGIKQPYIPTKVGRPVIKNIKETSVSGELLNIDLKDKIKKEIIDTILKEVRKKLEEIL